MKTMLIFEYSTEKLRKEGNRLSITEANHPIAKSVASIIESKGLKQVYVARKAGYTSQELSDMLNGRRLIKTCDIPKLACALGVPLNDLFAEDIDQKEESLSQSRQTL